MIHVPQKGPQCTFNVVELVIPPELAPITVFPAPNVVANPAPGPLAIVATLATDELQCELSVTSCEVPSLKLPVALNCCVVPTVTDGFAGATVMDCRVPVPTVRVVVPVTPEAVAEIVTDPLFLPCAIPD
jgi:hypothetical protein